MTHARHLIESVEELAPYPPSFAEHATARRRQPIEPAATLAGFLDPAPLHPPLLFELVEEWIERGRWNFSRFSDRSAMSCAISYPCR